MDMDLVIFILIFASCFNGDVADSLEQLKWRRVSGKVVAW